MRILLFDVDETICESGKMISLKMSDKLNYFIEKNVYVGIVGGGTFEKIMYQLNGLVIPHYIFSECGSVYHKLELGNYILINKHNLRLEPEYIKINILIKTCLRFISEVEYLISGNFIDLRNGLVYVSLVGMNGNDDERYEFIELDNTHHYRLKLIDILNKKAHELGITEYIDIRLGGNVGIAIYPKKWNKMQVLDWLDVSNEIHYFGDKYLPNGNDYDLLHNKYIIPHPIDSPEQTLSILNNL